MRTDAGPVGRIRNPIIEAARRAQIIDAAIETVAEVGYSRASLAQIARRGQLSKSVISYHFAGKHELFEQVVTEIYGDSWAFIEARLAMRSNPAGKIRAYIESNLAYLGAHRSRLLAVANIVANHRDADGTLRFSPTADESVITLLSDLLRQGQLEGEFREFPPRLVAVMIGQAIIGALGEWAANPEVDLPTYGEELVSLFDRATRR